MGKIIRVHAAGCMALFAIYIGLLPSIAGSKAIEAVELVPASIHNVQSGGFWTAGDDEGFFRVVVVSGGVEHVTHKLFIQWLRINPETQDYELARTVNIKKFNQARGFVLDVKTDFGDVNAFKIDVFASRRGEQKKHFEIIAKGDRDYIIQQK